MTVILPLLKKRRSTLNKLFKLRFEFTKAHGDIGFGALFVLLALYMRLIGINKFCKVGFGSVGIVDDKLLPNIIMVVALICAACILVMGLLDNRKDRQLREEGAALRMTEFSIYALLLAVIGIFFNMTFETIGYPLCNAVSMYAIFYMLGGKKIWHGVAVSVIFTVVSYLFFAKYLGVNLPLGFGL